MGELWIGWLHGHSPSLPPHTLTGINGVDGAVWGGGRRAELCPIHHPEEPGATQQRVGEGLGWMRAIIQCVAQDGLRQQELVGLLLHETWVGGSTVLQGPCTGPLPKSTPGCLLSKGSIDFLETVTSGSLSPQGQGPKTGSKTTRAKMRAWGSTRIFIQPG